MVDGNHHRAQEVVHALEIGAGFRPRRNVLVGARRGPELIAFRRIPRLAVVGEHAPASDQRLPLAGVEFVLLHGAPRITVAVDHAAARDGHVFHAPRRDRRLAAQRVETLERGLDKRIERLVVAENDDGVLFEMQFGIVFQLNRPGVPDAFGNDHTTASPGGQGGDGVGESRGVERMAVARAAEIGDADRIRRNRGPGDLRHLERKVAGRGVCAASCGGCQERRGCANRHLSEVHKRGGFIRIRKIFAISGIQKYTAPAYRTGIF